MIEIKEHVALAPITTFRIGGEARYFIEVSAAQDLYEAVMFSKEKNIPFVVLGGGSNVLVNDKGFDGAVIKIKLQELHIEGELIEVQAGVPLIKAVNVAAQAGLSGIELLAGIPGTVGGAVRGNAGAFGAMIGYVVESVLVMDVQSGEYKTVPADACEFTYRDSFFKHHPEYIIVSAKLKLQQADAKDVLAKTKETIAKRAANHLSGEKSAGSYFMNPVVTDEKLRSIFARDKGVQPKDDKLPAGWLIEQVDLRGKKMGGAMVSEKHANYIINTGEATAEDVIMLESYVKQQVRDTLGVQLQAEVSYVGF